MCGFRADMHSSTCASSCSSLRKLSVGLVLLLVALVTRQVQGRQLPASGRGLSGEVCRGEDICLDQFCDPASYQYFLKDQSADFPYDISFTKETVGATSKFKFVVCGSSKSAEACEGGGAGCSPLTSVKLRMRNDMLSMGRDLVTSPKGKMWASCSDHGPGHVWEGQELGSVALGQPSNGSCTTLEVVANNGDERAASIQDICQQGVKIVDSAGDNVYDLSDEMGSSCLFVLELANGRVGYTTVTDLVKVSAEVIDMEEGIAMGPSAKPYGRVNSYGKKLLGSHRRRVMRRRLF